MSSSLPLDKILDKIKFKAFVDKINVYEKFKFVFRIAENIVGKGENAGNQHFLPFPQCFQKAPVAGFLKFWWKRVNFAIHEKV